MKHCQKCNPTVEMKLLVVHEEMTYSLYRYVCPVCKTADGEEDLKRIEHNK
ncbi:hypothetical protein LKL24_12330 [Bacillus halotolerans]|uniref:hypothetical protein n=1 Tax=Bacillus halotolerans TaxID=260554 RepID=UPI001D0E8ACB|nr:hypothetical protein [Bacillus halotolerans]MCC2528202.1 hypothetical protein [Bacillus halotolerans]